jgi:ferric-dicitrate binding protein FerR (iron transport regulator)
MHEDDHLRLIARKISGSIEAHEEEALRIWISESQENELLFRRLEDYWLRSNVPARLAGQQEVFERIARTLDMPTEQKTVKPVRRMEIWHPTWRVAAALLAIMLSGLAIWYALNRMPDSAGESDQNTHHILSKSNPSGRKSLIALPDGTMVNLNSESYIEYNADFSNMRQVNLIGEAFFSVVSDASRPFLIQVGEMQVQVLGTSFNIRAFPFANTMSVAVAEGTVQVARRSDNTLTLLDTLRKDQMISVDHQSGEYMVRAFDPDEVLAWKEGVLVFKQESYQEIFDRLERWYGVEIEVKKMPAIKEGFTARYNNASLEEVLEGISYTSGVQYRIEGKKVKIF